MGYVHVKANEAQRYHISTLFYENLVGGISRLAQLNDL